MKHFTHWILLITHIFPHDIFQPDQQQKQQEQLEQRTMQINSMLSQLLSQEARARLNTLKISKPEKAEIVRNLNETPDGLER